MIPTLNIVSSENTFYWEPPAQGTFFTLRKDNKIGAMDTCRELFSYNFSISTRRVGFYGNRLDVKKIAKFFDIIETRLKLAEKSVVHQTNHKRAIVVVLSPFWTENTTRRGFFTLFLRCACIHYIDSVEEALKSYHLAREIPFTIRHFLDGYCKPTYKRLRYGLVSTFQPKTKDQIRKMLVKP
jgi:hypothetical protein